MNSEPSSMPDNSQLAEQIAGVALVCGVLGKILYTYPDRDWLQSLVDDRLFDEVPLEPDHPSGREGLSLLQKWSEACGESIPEEMFDALRRDYTRLFIGPGQPLAAPWESVHLSRTGLTFQAETLDVRRWYARSGLEFEKLHNEPDDHVGVELAFVSALASQAVDSLSEDGHENITSTMDDLRGFADQHLLKWAPAWCRKSAEVAETDLYQGTLKMTEGCLHDLAELLDIRLVEVLN
jgi:TorA maturation chaperone TorD